MPNLIDAQYNWISPPQDILPLTYRASDGASQFRSDLDKLTEMNKSQWPEPEWRRTGTVDDEFRPNLSFSLNISVKSVVGGGMLRRSLMIRKFVRSIRFSMYKVESFPYFQSTTYGVANGSASYSFAEGEINFEYHSIALKKSIAQVVLPTTYEKLTDDPIEQRFVHAQGMYEDTLTIRALMARENHTDFFWHCMGTKKAGDTDLQTKYLFQRMARYVCCFTAAMYTKS